MKKDDMGDVITLVGELEHARRHLNLMAVNEDSEEKVKTYLILAHEFRKIRQGVMDDLGISRENWCYFKTLCIIRQLMMEIDWTDDEDMDVELFPAYDLRFINDLIEKCVEGVDVSHCMECGGDEDGQE